MPLQFLIGIGSFGDENLILFTGLKETLKPKRERILEILKEIEDYKIKFSSPKDPFPIENRSASILSHVLLVILVILAKQQNGWKPGWMNIVEKLKTKRFIPHPLHLIVSLTIIFFDFTKLVKRLLSFPFLIWIYEAYVWKNSTNLVNDCYSTLSTSDALKLLV